MYGCIRHVALCAAVAVGLAAALQGQFQKKNGNLPTLEEVLHKPAMTIDQISATYTELEKHLQAEQYQMTAEQAEKKSLYARELRSKLEEQRSILTQNSELETRLTTVHDVNKKLRSQAAQLVHANEALSVDMQVAQGNMSNAADFVASAIDESRTLLQNSSALAVLAELAEKDASMTNERTQKSKMAEIRGHAAMIQTTAQKESPQNVLAEIMSSMDVLAQAHNESMVKMKSEFDANAGVIDERSKNLLEKQSELNASLAEEAIIHKKLLSALTHLRALNQRLIEQSRSVRMFAQRFSGNKVTGTVVVGDEPESVLSKASNVVLGFSQLFHSAVSSETNSEARAVKPAHSVSAATEAYVAKSLDSAVQQETTTSSLNHGASAKSVSPEAAQPVTHVAPAAPASTISGEDIASLKAVPRKKKHVVTNAVAKTKTPPSPSDGGNTDWVGALKKPRVTELVAPAPLASHKAETAAPASHSSDGESATTKANGASLHKSHVHAKLAAPTHTKSATPTHTKSATPTHTKSAAPTSTNSKYAKPKSTRKHKASGAKA